MGRGCDLRESQEREKTNPTGNQTPTTRDREGFREDGEGETGGSHGREKTQPNQREPDPHSQRTESDSERGEGVIYEKTKNVDAVRRLLGQSSVTATSAYLGVSDNSALELARTINV